MCSLNARFSPSCARSRWTLRTSISLAKTKSLCRRLVTPLPFVCALLIAGPFSFSVVLFASELSGLTILSPPYSLTALEVRALLKDTARLSILLGFVYASIGLFWAWRTAPTFTEKPTVGEHAVDRAMSRVVRARSNVERAIAVATAATALILCMLPYILVAFSLDAQDGYRPNEGYEGHTFAPVVFFFASVAALLACGAALISQGALSAERRV